MARKAIGLISALVGLVMVTGVAKADVAISDIQKPAGAGPFPAILMVPACAGFNMYALPDYNKWRDMFVAAGFVTARIDYVLGRSLNLCVTFNPLREAVTKKEAAADVDRAIADLEKTGYVVPSHISLIGWSYGGGVELQVLSGAAGAKLHSVVAFYPDCSNVDAWHAPVKTLILFAGDGTDTIAPPSQCKALIGQSNGASVQTQQFAGAYHAFDFSTLPPQGIVFPNGTMRYDAAAASQAWDTATAFLKQ